MIRAVISESRAHLDLDDTQLWISAGLTWVLDHDAGLGVMDASIPPSGPIVMGSANDDDEDRRANEIIWLLLKITSHLLAGDALVPEDYARSASARCPVGVTQEQLLRRWGRLDTMLSTWHRRLPPSFQAAARTSVSGERRAATSERGEQGNTSFEQVWYHVPLCAAAMLSYHMCRILLLVNRPQESTAIRSSVTARIRCYEDTIREATSHAREICGINLANPPHSVLLHSLEPLYVAGQVLRSHYERTTIVGMFGDIERNTGWSTSFHVAKLQREWQQGGDWVIVGEESGM